MARILLQRGATTEALRHLEAAIAAAPQERLGRRLLANLLAQQGRYQEALPHYGVMIEQDPRDAEARLFEATALVLAGRYELAKKRLEEAAALLPEALPLRHSLARLLATCPDASVRDGARALELAQALFAAAPDLESGETLAMALAETGRYEEAAALQGKLLAAVEKDGDPARLAALKATHERYLRGEPTRAPWSRE
jgi:tetratricopeptide (TPR) repeat protein